MGLGQTFMGNTRLGLSNRGRFRAIALGICCHGFRDSFGVPPGLEFNRESGGKQCGDKRFAAIAWTDNFDTVRGEALRCQIGYKPLANATPTGFFAVPLKTATGPGQLFSIKQATAGANHAIGQVCARTQK